jgi:hypothetical protein
MCVEGYKNKSNLIREGINTLQNVRISSEGRITSI